MGVSARLCLAMLAASGAFSSGVPSCSEDSESFWDMEAATCQASTSSSALQTHAVSDSSKKTVTEVAKLAAEHGRSEERNHEDMSDQEDEDDHSSVFKIQDCQRYKTWANDSSEGACSRIPRVLIFTFLTEDYYSMFENEIYWKLCYAHMHGFDVEFTDQVQGNVGAGKRGKGGKNHSVQKHTLHNHTLQNHTEQNQTAPDSKNSYGNNPYGDEMMWAFSRALRNRIDLDYDYIFATGADVQFLKVNLDFPVWQWDRGHHMTLMDQDYCKWGFNENNMLFKIAGGGNSWVKDFFDGWYGDNKNSNSLQGDNGPYMETILKVISHESKEDEGIAYDGRCLKKLRLDGPSTELIAHDEATGSHDYEQHNKDYSDCFFAELNRLAGPFNNRSSQHVGFARVDDHSTPWANCWAWVRDTWTEPEKHCFAYHWNGPKNKAEPHTVQPGCPAPGFDETVWSKSPYNPKNRKAQQQ
eukprot:TRINITY_DN88529_c0_g1_i1.p1 TRINITY_DN88529_c0_g1~~TRINITY_DN88529_c0_g1_i1.p1  ORF type:complete len:469 (-),score=86.58 TRINITY_DN88529_c0_g1_i1:71-1477(-)